MATIHCTLKELARGIEVPLDERTKFIVSPDATRASLVGRAFEGEKNFILPRAVPALKELFAFVQSTSKQHVLVVGHTRTSGDAAVSERVSLARAEAAGAWLLNDPAPWVDQYAEDVDELQRWGKREDHSMINAVLGPDAAPATATAASPNQGATRTKDPLVEAFQRVAKVTADGIAGPITRKALVLAYFALSRTSSKATETETAPSTEPPKVELELLSHGAGESFAKDEPSDGRIDFFFAQGQSALEPAAGDVAGPEFQEWVDAATQHRLFSVGAAGGTGSQISLQLFDKSGRFFHKRQRYELDGPESLAGITDSEGRIQEQGVPAGDYELKLTLEFFEDPNKIIEEHALAAVVLDNDQAEQVRMVGAVPHCILATLRGLVFDTDKSFILSSAIEGLKKIRTIYEQNGNTSWATKPNAPGFSAQTVSCAPTPTGPYKVRVSSKRSK